MPWTATFKQDTTKPGVGTVTAIDSVTGTVFVDDQLNTGNATKVAAFVTKAKAAAAAAAEKKSAEDAIAQALATALNS